MAVLGFLWLVLLVIELTEGLGPVLQKLGLVIWGLLILDFVVKFTLAPDKLQFWQAC